MKLIIKMSYININRNKDIILKGRIINHIVIFCLVQY